MAENCYFSYFFAQFFEREICIVLERDFQKKLIKEMYQLFPGCYILKNDSEHFQGIPDLTILYKQRWATLEVKEARNASHQPNQDRYVEDMNRQSFSAFIFPENKKEVLNELTKHFNG